MHGFGIAVKQTESLGGQYCIELSRVLTRESEDPGEREIGRLGDRESERQKD